jgi:hypothetical protein
LVRAAKGGDPDFKAGQDQVIIKNVDGSRFSGDAYEKTVPRADVKDVS